MIVLIGWKCGASFIKRSLNLNSGKPKQITFDGSCSSENRSKDLLLLILVLINYPWRGEWNFDNLFISKIVLLNVLYIELSLDSSILISSVIFRIQVPGDTWYCGPFRFCIWFPRICRSPASFLRVTKTCPSWFTSLYSRSWGTKWKGKRCF